MSARVRSSAVVRAFVRLRSAIHAPYSALASTATPYSALSVVTAAPSTVSIMAQPDVSQALTCVSVGDVLVSNDDAPPTRFLVREAMSDALAYAMPYVSASIRPHDSNILAVVLLSAHLTSS